MITTLATLSFLAPWWAAGAVVAVGLPLLAHLFSRARYREVLFPATRFVQQAVLETARLERPRHRLLMLLRWLMLLLVVVAFMRPRWLPQADAAEAQDGVALILLLDASASMQRTYRGAALFDRARQQADQQLGALDPARDVAAVVVVRGRSRSLLPEPTANFTLLRQRLDPTLISHEAADWEGAAAIAERLASVSRQPTRIVVISDQQGDAPLLNTTDQLQDFSVSHVRIDGPRRNTAVRLTDVRPYPPIVGGMVEVEVACDHFGEASGQVALTAKLGDAVQRRNVTLRPGYEQRLTFRLPVDTRALSTLRISIDEPDTLPSDDRTGVVFLPSNGSRAMLVHGSGADDLRRAQRVGLLLRPGAVLDRSLPTIEFVEAERAAARLMQSDVSTLRTVVLLPDTGMQADLRGVLTAYLQRGGGVVSFNRMVSNEAMDGERPLVSLVRPADPGEPRATRAGQIDFGDPMFDAFQGPARAGLSALTWPGVDDLRLSQSGESLLESPDGRVILAGHLVGRGRWMQINAALSTTPGGLLAEPAFVVLFNEICRYVSPGASPPAALHPGMLMPTTMRQGDRITGPSDALAVGDPIPEPGGYYALDPAGQRMTGVWAEIDPVESDPRIGRGWIGTAGSDEPQDALSAERSAQTAAMRAEHVELWPYVLLGVLLLAASESGLLARFSKPGGAGG